MKVRFGDVVKEVKVNIDRAQNPYEFYVAGDHMDSEDFKIRRRGRFATDDVGPAFTRCFKPGQILYGSRRTYLKKVCVADFEGICANTTFVFETKDANKLDQRMLPFLMLSDGFTKWSIQHSKGSTNPYVLFSDLADYEFDLPPIEKQRELAELLWVANDLKESYKKLIVASDEMLKAKFREMFGECDPRVHSESAWPLLSFGEFAIIDATMTSEYAKYADYPHIGIDSIMSESGELKGYRTVKQDNVISGKYVFTPRHIIYSKIRPNLNKVALPDFSGLCSADSYPILPRDCCNRIFLAHVMRSYIFLDYILPHSARTGMPKVNREQLLGFSMRLPPLALQQEFVEIARKVDETKAALKKSIADVESVIKGLING